MLPLGVVDVDAWFGSVLTGAGPIGVLAALMVYVLRHLEAKDSANRETAKQFADVQERSFTAIDRNTTAMTEVACVLRDIRRDGRQDREAKAA